MNGTRDVAPHDELPCALWPRVERRCTAASVVSVVIDANGNAEWACERHAAAALAWLDGAKIKKVADGAAAERLLALPWNRQPREPPPLIVRGSAGY